MPLTNIAFSDLITFTRASTGTYVGSNGLIQTAVTNTPRFDYNPTTLTPLGFLIEEQRTNLVLYSEQSDNAVWTLQRVTVTPNTDVAPDGTTTADLTTGTGASGGAMGTNQTVSVSASTAYTISGFFKAGTSTWVILTGFDGTTSPRAWFNLISGTIGSVETGMTNATIQNYGNGWYRCSVVRTTGAAATSLRWQMSHSTGNDTTATSATLTLTVWGAQIETGAFPTSYIPTTTATGTRAADVASINTLSPWYNAAEGTLFAAYSILTARTSEATFTRVDSGSDANRLQLGTGASFVVYNPFVITANVSQGGSAVSINPLGTHKVAAAVAANNFAGAMDGTLGPVDTLLTMPSSISRLCIGNSNNSSQFINGYLQKIIYYPKRLTNSELQALTS